VHFIRCFGISVATASGFAADPLTTAEILAVDRSLEFKVESEDIHLALSIAAETVRKRELPVSRRSVVRSLFTPRIPTYSMSLA